MTLVRKLKALYKTAVRSGKIVYLGPKHKFRQDEDFTLFQKQLPPIEWKQFEEREFLFRKHIASKKVNYGDFHCKGDIDIVKGQVDSSFTWCFLQRWQIS